MTLLRSSIRTALRQTAPAARFFSSIARGSPGCSNATSALRRTAPSARFFSSVARGSPGCTSALRRPALTSSFFGNGGGGSSGFRRMMCSYGNGGHGFWNQGLSWERSDLVFFGITGAVMCVVQMKVRALQEENWQRRIKDIEVRSYMMDKEKEVFSWMPQGDDYLCNGGLKVVGATASCVTVVSDDLRVATGSFCAFS